SPYKARVVALLDQPPPDKVAVVETIRAELGDRLVVLGAPSIEESLPEGLYAKADRNKGDDLRTLLELKARDAWRDVQTLKGRIARELANSLEVGDLADLHEVVSAVEIAIARAQAGEEVLEPPSASE